MTAAMESTQQYQGLDPGPMLEPKQQSRMGQAIDELESAGARLDAIVGRARDQLAPILRLQEPSPDKPDYPPMPAVAAHTSRIVGATTRVNLLCDSLIDLLECLDV
jgi:hypothetical protein